MKILQYITDRVNTAIEKRVNSVVTEELIKGIVTELCKTSISDVRAIAKEVISKDVKFMCDLPSIKQSINTQIKWAIISFIQQKVTFDKLEKWRTLAVDKAIIKRKKYNS